ncbi:hypothetical protein [Burkholderia cenocepacia]|uniref:hypothetical protein n=1 Tax=Burkholderia cenocepacia TaxID=95486 RepID=UPI0035BBB973
MLRKLIASGPLLSRGLRDAISACLALLYVGVYANARVLLPEFIFRDAEKIQTQIGGGSTYDGSSFDAVGKLYQALGGAGTAVFVALPNAAYSLLQQLRDLAVDYLMYASPFGARTSFYNPLPPDSFVHFAGNYAYSLVRLNLPVLFSFDPKGFAMQALVALFLGAAWRRVPS